MVGDQASIRAESAYFVCGQCSKWTWYPPKQPESGDSTAAARQAEQDKEVEAAKEKERAILPRPLPTLAEWTKSVAEGRPEQDTVMVDESDEEDEDDAASEAASA